MLADQLEDAHIGANHLLIARQGRELAAAEPDLTTNDPADAASPAG
jgi:hypothetical protein